MLKNHDMEGEPMGRVVAARFIDTNDGKGLRIFQYAKGVAYFTTVIKEPKVKELTNEWKKSQENKKTRK